MFNDWLCFRPLSRVTTRLVEVVGLLTRTCLSLLLPAYLSLSALAEPHTHTWSDLHLFRVVHWRYFCLQAALLQLLRVRGGEPDLPAGLAEVLGGGQLCGHPGHPAGHPPGPAPHQAQDSLHLLVSLSGTSQWD